MATVREGFLLTFFTLKEQQQLFRLFGIYQKQQLGEGFKGYTIRPLPFTVENDDKDTGREHEQTHLFLERSPERDFGGTVPGLVGLGLKRTAWHRKFEP